MARVKRTVVCVDDEPAVLEGLELQLRRRYQVRTATSGEAGLELLREIEEAAVVLSDMRMPEMNGATFLAHARDVRPNAVRMLLTGQTELEDAMAAVNDGQIFRFLMKPCPSKVLLEAVGAAIEQNRLLTAEKELLEQTLKGSIQVLIDVLGLAAPNAFVRASILKGYVGHMAAQLELEDPWQFELAAMLCRIGAITLPPSTLDKVYAGQPLEPAEQEMYDALPSTGSRLLGNVPRLQSVAEIIRRQGADAEAGASDADPDDASVVDVGTDLLRVALALDERVVRGRSLPRALEDLRREPGIPGHLLDALKGFRADPGEDVTRALPVVDLKPHMVLDEDVCSGKGMVLIKKGHELTPAILERLANFQRGVGVVEPIRVRIPRTGAASRPDPVPVG